MVCRIVGWSSRVSTEWYAGHARQQREAVLQEQDVALRRKVEPEERGRHQFAFPARHLQGEVGAGLSRLVLPEGAEQLLLRAGNRALPGIGQERRGGGGVQFRAQVPAVRDQPVLHPQAAQPEILHRRPDGPVKLVDLERLTRSALLGLVGHDRLRPTSPIGLP